MQIKKEIFLFGLLIVFSISLLIASTISERPEACVGSKSKSIGCCQEKLSDKSESPWNFITGGILHLSV
jgi:hypothetical protein